MSSANERHRVRTSSRWAVYGATAAALLPYGARCAFATALDGDIACRNRSRPRLRRLR